ncbi:MAG: 30S ribosomal protein S7 [Chlamydiales bacterium]
MGRRRHATKRTIAPDSVYQSELITKFINKVMIQGKKSTARKIVYEAIDKFTKNVNEEDPISALNMAFNNARPYLEVKSRRIGGATYQVPIEIPPDRQNALVMKWIIQYSRAKPGKAMQESLAIELTDCYKNQGSTIKKKEDTHRMAEANKAFSHYKW